MHVIVYSHQAQLRPIKEKTYTSLCIMGSVISAVWTTWQGFI